jgi:hypothetical protein
MTRLLSPLLGAAFVVTLAAGGPVLAQDKVYRSADAVSGKRVRLGAYENVSKECAPGPLPEIKVLTPPKNGSLTVSHGKTKAGALPRCPKLEVPAQGVFYQANPRYTGVDEVAYEVKRSDRPTQSVTVKITVGAQAKPGSAAKEGTDL